MTAANTPRPPLARALGAGLLSRLLTGVAANLAHVVVSRPRGLYFVELAPARVFAATVALNLLGGAVYWALAGGATARRSFALVAAAAAAALSLAALALPLRGFFATVLVVHGVVALGAALVIPRAAR